MNLDWHGLRNARDLGGLLTTAGRTRSGVYVRSDHPSSLSDEGWNALRAFGVRTIVSLHTAGLSVADATIANQPLDCPFDDIAVVALPIEDAGLPGFRDAWINTGLWLTPLYWHDVLTRTPELPGAVLEGLASAEKPVLFHCGRGHDRTGLAAMLLATVAGVTVGAATADYLLSSARLRGGPNDRSSTSRQLLDAKGVTAESAFADLMKLAQSMLDDGLASEATRYALRRPILPDA